MNIRLFIPLRIRSKRWCQQFHNDKPRDVDPVLETALYRIEGTKLFLNMAIFIKLLAPNHSLDHFFLAWEG